MLMIFAIGEPVNCNFAILVVACKKVFSGFKIIELYSPKNRGRHSHSFRSYMRYIGSLETDIYKRIQNANMNNKQFV